MKRIVFTVTNDLAYDQRMIRICTSLANTGYSVMLIGNRKPGSPPLADKNYQQKRIFTFFKTGFGFYAEYNLRLFMHLLFTKNDLFCCIDLDTMIPVWLAGKLRSKIIVYDAHEYFSQQKEIISRPFVYRIWKWIEKTFVPKFKNGYTVSFSIAGEFKNLYGSDYQVIRNLPVKVSQLQIQGEKGKNLLYQGAINEARGLEFLIPAMKKIDAQLEIYGDGNFLDQTKSLIIKNNLQDKVFLRGKVLPENLDLITQGAYVGINLVENNGLNQYYSLANKFFDYIQNGLPQVTMNFPEYKRINDEFEVAILLDDLTENNIVSAVNKLLTDKYLYQRLQQNCLTAGLMLNWQHEEKKLIDFYKKFG